MKHAGLFLLFSTILSALLPASTASISSVDASTSATNHTVSGTTAGLNRDPVKPVPWGKPHA